VEDSETPLSSKGILKSLNNVVKTKSTLETIKQQCIRLSSGEKKLTYAQLGLFKKEKTKKEGNKGPPNSVYSLSAKGKKLMTKIKKSYLKNEP